jgi:hypothetical protein
MCEEKARLKELNNSNEADTSKPDWEALTI